MDSSTFEVIKLGQICRILNDFMKQHKIDETHGFGHAMIVTNHAYLACNDTNLFITSNQRLLILVASLLHDVDDSKYFTTQNYDNCVEIMTKCKFTEDAIKEVVHMISLVSCSKNGNSDKGCEFMWQLIPRYADRLESTGIEGAKRCFEYNKHVNRPMFDENTPRPKTKEEAYECATHERFQNYVNTHGNSSTMMDHFFDKMIQVAHPPQPHIEHSEYLSNEFKKRVDPLIDVCVYFGVHGKISPKLF
jgi:HD superfamily phosphodiesterase